VQTITKPQIVPLSLQSSQSSGTHAPYTQLALRVGLRFALRLLRGDLRHMLCIWRDAFHSFLGHIRTQSSRGQACVRLGPHSYQGARDARTLVRTLYTQKLLAICPWVDSQDLELFLMGFEAGETFAADSRDRLYPEQLNALDASWISPEITHEIHITLDMLKRQWYKSQYESVGRSNPSQSD
jgi:hypothetical protein